MRANISDEIHKAIDDKIYFDLMLHIAQSRYMKAESEGNKGYANYLDLVYKEIKKDSNVVIDYLKANHIRIQEVEKLDDMFVRYNYHQRLHGGFKEGYNQYWVDALKLELKRRLCKYFGGE